MRILAGDPGSPDALVLIAELSAALAAITGDPGTASFDPDDVRGARAAFLLAYDGDGADGAPLGCGALRPLDAERGEIKRMYARPGTGGVGAALLAQLEQAARGFGYQALVLSTRRVNQRAVDFYRRHGYADIAPYGRYAGVTRSICLGKDLQAAAQADFL